MIMSNDCEITTQLRQAQADMFRVAMDPRRYGKSMKSIAALSGIPYETLRTYASGAATMPITALVKLCGVLPADLLSVLLPGEFRIVEARTELDHADLAAKAGDYAMTYMAARDPNSECGTEIGPREAAALSSKAASLTT